MGTDIERVRRLPSLAATDPARWSERRNEMLELFRRHVFGRAPACPPDLRFEILEQTDALNGAAVARKVAIRFTAPGGEGTIQTMGFIPKNRRGPVPAFVLIDHWSQAVANPFHERLVNLWPVDLIVARGYATFGFPVADLDPDADDDFRNGVHGLFDQGRRDGESWGALSAWAWGASRVLDYLQTDRNVDARRVGVIGHSRGGKTALWAGAQDERFDLAISNNSGTGGAALARGCTGESLATINKAFPHWFCGNYRAYADNVEQLPVDMHMLIALLAPRHAYIASAADDWWADPASECAAAAAAGPAFALFGQAPLEAPQLPPVGTVRHDTAPAYHLRAGGHALRREDWEHYLDCADRIWNKPR